VYKGGVLLAASNYTVGGTAPSNVTFTFTDNAQYSYSFAVIATVGTSTLTSATSAAVNSVAPISAFSTPVAASSSAGVVTLSWTGGSASGVTYTYSVYKASSLITTGFTVSGTAPNVTFTFTDTGSYAYYFTITATVGASSITSSQSNTVTSFNAALYLSPTYYYPFNTNAQDFASGSGVNDATVTGTLTYSSTNYVMDGGAMFTSTTAYIGLPTMTMSSNGFSITLWYYFTASPSARIFEFSNSYANAFMIWIGDPNSYTPRYQDNVTGGAAYSRPMTVNKWYHFAVVLSPTLNTAQIYVNGIPSASIPTTYSTVSSITRANNMLGYNYQSGGAFAAGYDDVRIYNGTVLTAAQVATIFNFKSSGPLGNYYSPTPTYYYPFDTDAKDYSSGSGVNNATVTGTLSYSSTNYNVGSGAMFTSTTAYINLPTMTMSSNGFSITLWYYFTASSSARIFEFSNNYNNAFMLWIGDPNSNTPRYQDNVTGGQAYNTTMTVNTWYHFAVVLSPTLNTAQIYVNGSPSASIPTTYSTVSSITRTTNMLGYNYQAPAGFAAGYDDVRIYNGTVLTAAQVAAIYNLD